MNVFCNKKVHNIKYFYWIYLKNDAPFIHHIPLSTDTNNGWKMRGMW